MAASKEVIVLAALRTELFFVRPPKKALGVGKMAAIQLKEILAQKKPKGIIIVGYAGGLSLELPPTSLVLADRLLSEQGEILVHQELLVQAKNILPQAKVGPIFTDVKLAKKERKAELGEKAVAVDMESFFLAEILERAGVPYLVLRAVLDTVKEELSWFRFRYLGRAVLASRKLGQGVATLRPILGGMDA